MTMTKAILVTCLVAVGCKKQIDAEKAETAMRDNLATKGVTAKVTCPGGRAAKAGDTFDCDATDSLGAGFKIHVTQKDDAGSIEWKLEGNVVDTAVVIADAKAKMPNAKIECPSKGMIVKGSGGSFRCPLTDGDKKSNLVVKVDGTNVGWEVSP